MNRHEKIWLILAGTVFLIILHCFSIELHELQRSTRNAQENIYNKLINIAFETENYWHYLRKGRDLTQYYEETENMVNSKLRIKQMNNDYSLVDLYYKIEKLNRAVDSLVLKLSRISQNTTIRYKTPILKKTIQDATITNEPEGVTKNFGNGRLLLGVRDEDKTYRVLIKASELKDALPSSIRIVSASLFLYEFRSSELQRGALSERIVVYGINKDWAEGRGDGDVADGEVTWFDAKYHQEEWNVPGVWGEENKDVWNYVLAEGVNHRSNAEELLEIYFNSAGIEYLENLINKDESNFGFILKLDKENYGNTFFSFGSMEDEPAYRPYFVIEYQLIQPGN